MSQEFKSVSDELARALAVHHDRPALRDRDLCLSYAELAGFVNACRPVLESEKAVAVYGAPGALFGAAATACVILGRPFVHLDPAMPNSVLENILAELEIGLVLTSQPAREGQLPVSCRVVDAAGFLGSPAVVPVKPGSFAPDHPIYLVATSGTTGRPKCIPVTHDAAYLSYAWRDAYTPYQPGMRVGCYIFAIWEMFRPLRNGAEVCFPGLSDLLSPQALAGFIADHELHEMLFTPSFFEKMLQGLDHATAAALPLRRIVLNGEVVSDRLIAETLSKMPEVELWNLYSICETHDICMSKVTGPSSRSEGVSVGRAMPYLRAIVLDDHDQICPPGTPGLLHFEGPRMLGPGYVNRPEETARRFREVTLEGRSQRLYDTGDRGLVEEDGEIVVMGRVAHMLKLRGYSIQTRELTETMAGLIGFSNAIPWVQDLGEQGQALVFYYTADADQAATNAASWQIQGGQTRIPEALGQALREVLPAYCVPSYLVQLDEIPIHAVSGKCNYKVLPEILLPPTGDVYSGDTLPSVAHAARILCCDANQIDPERSFGDLGGDSLMCVDLIVSLERAYQTRVDFDWALNLPLSRLHQLLTVGPQRETRATFDREGIFLTGATGFLGSHVLAQAIAHLPKTLAVYCLVRPGQQDAQARLDAVTKDLPHERIILVEGTLDQPDFGLDQAEYAALCDRVTTVIHCAATVNLAAPRAQMEEWSRLGIETVLKLCRDAEADLRFSSSTAVFADQGGPHPEAPAQIFEGCSGYGAAKIAAEAQIAGSGVPALALRLPSLYDLQTANPNDVYENILRACREGGCLPASLSFPMSDVRAAALLLVAAKPAEGVVYGNFVAGRIALTHEAFDTLSVADWLARAPLSEPLRRLIATDHAMLSATAQFENANAKAEWHRAGLGEFSAISEPDRLIAARLSYQREPALT